MLCNSCSTIYFLYSHALQLMLYSPCSIVHFLYSLLCSLCADFDSYTVPLHVSQNQPRINSLLTGPRPYLWRLVVHFLRKDRNLSKRTPNPRLKCSLQSSIECPERARIETSTGRSASTGGSTATTATTATHIGRSSPRALFDCAPGFV